MDYIEPLGWLFLLVIVVFFMKYFFSTSVDKNDISDDYSQEVETLQGYFGKIPTIILLAITTIFLVLGSIGSFVADALNLSDLSDLLNITSALYSVIFIWAIAFVVTAIIKVLKWLYRKMFK